MLARFFKTFLKKLCSENKRKIFVPSSAWPLLRCAYDDKFEKHIKVRVISAYKL